MFRVIFRNLQQQITSNNPTSSHFINLVVVAQNHQNNPFLKSISNIPESIKQHSLTVDYLVNSCGLPLEKALSAAKRFKLCSIEKADSVISLFQSYGFTKTHITKIISVQPQLLYIDSNKTLKPKLEFLSDLGVSETDFSKIFARSPVLLTSSLEKVLLPNISILKVHGVPDYNISKILITNPRTLCDNSNRFNETVEKVKKMGFDTESTMFYRAIYVLTGLSKSSWDKKLMVYREYGLLENDVISAFKKQPICMQLSEDKIRRGLEFFLKKLKCKPADISFYPVLLMLSLDKRITPRCSVLKILYSKGIISNKLSLTTVFTMAEAGFSEKFVLKYQETVAEVMSAYKGGIEFEGFGEVVEVKNLYLEPVIDHIPPVVTAV